MTLYDPSTGQTEILKDGNLRGYEAFIPNNLPPESLSEADFSDQIDSIIETFTELRSILESIPNLTPYLDFIVQYEASRSSKIEGIDRDIREYYKNRATGDTIEAQKQIALDNYVRALQLGRRSIEDNNELTPEDILRIHQTLMDRIEEYEQFETNPGELRERSMLIGDPNELRTGEEYYIAPPMRYIRPKLDNWLEYFNHSNGNTLDPLIDNAVLHAQFEMIHGFADGNGRTGRILSILHLLHEGMIDSPALGLSRFLESNREAYFDHLDAISHRGDWEGYVRFHLKALDQAADFTGQTLEDLHDVVKNARRVLHEELRRAKYNEPLLGHLLKFPITSAKSVTENLGCSRPTAYDRLEKFESVGLVETDESSTKTLYRFTDFLDVIEKPESDNNLERDESPQPRYRDKSGRWELRSKSGPDSK